ncbi:hypothetical protein [Sorangium sp. So ce854]|uniref:hypothetical protein n=1 Tax=Sorangium sp. So ce854 TaxID=3133322 RepID=UPI003F6291A2
MTLIQLVDALTACAVADPWPFDGSDLLETLSRIAMTAGVLEPPFSPEVELSDRFIVVDHAGHVPESSVRGFAGRTELEAFILGPAGLTNPFTTFCVAFVDGIYCPFRLIYVDGARDVEFSKAAQLDRGPFKHEYPKLRIEWSPAAWRRS